MDAATGALLWKSYTITEEPKPLRVNGEGAVEMQGPSGAAVWSSPTVDLKARMVYVTTGDAYSEPAADTADSFVAFQMDTGKLAWSHQATKGDIYTIGCVLPTPVNCSGGRWVFYDRSKPSNRRWCSSELCGNREETRTYRRHAGVPA